MANTYASNRAPATAASATTNGYLTTGTQTIAGAKTFSSTPIVPGLTLATGETVTNDGTAKKKLTIKSAIVNAQCGPGDCAITFDTAADIASNVLIAGFAHNGDRAVGIDGAGRIQLENVGDSSGTPGDATISGAVIGWCSVAGGSKTVVITDATIGASSFVIPWVASADATLTSVSATVASGQVTLTGNANATGTTKFGFIIFNR